MNQGDYVAIATISMPVIAAALLSSFKREKSVSSKRVLGMVAIGFLAHIVIQAFSICMCHWSPARFITIAVLSEVVCATFLQSKALRIGSFVLFSFAVWRLHTSPIPDTKRFRFSRRSGLANDKSPQVSKRQRSF